LIIDLYENNNTTNKSERTHYGILSVFIKKLIE